MNAAVGACAYACLRMSHSTFGTLRRVEGPDMVRLSEEIIIGLDVEIGAMKFISPPVQ